MSSLPKDDLIVEEPTFLSNFGNLKLQVMQNPDEQELDGSEQVRPQRSILSGSDSVSSTARRKKLLNILTLGTLVLINLLNYMDRFTVSGVLPKIQNAFHMGDTESGLLQTVFFAAYMLASPVFGYLGDHWTRKWLMTVGITFWTVVTFMSSFIEDKVWFIVFRGFVGIGEASYSTIAPTIIADLYVDSARTVAYMAFYFAIPVGSGLGYIVGSTAAKIFDDWRFALRVTPLLGVVCVVLIVILVREPARGEAEGGTHVRSSGSVWADVRSLLTNKSFMCCTFGFVGVSFVAGALAFWAPKYILYAYMYQGRPKCDHGKPSGCIDLQTVSFAIGGITVAAGVIGVAAGAAWAHRWRRSNPSAEPYVCAIGLIGCSPMIFGALWLSQYNVPLAYVMVLIGETLLCLNWTIVAEIIMNTVLPTRRSLAEAIQILLGHALGDAGSPFLIGALTDTLNPMGEASTSDEYLALRRSLYLTCFVSVLGGFSFLVNALYYPRDKAIVQAAIAESSISDRAAIVDHEEPHATDDPPIRPI